MNPWSSSIYECGFPSLERESIGVARQGWGEGRKGRNKGKWKGREKMKGEMEEKRIKGK